MYMYTYRELHSYSRLKQYFLERTSSRSPRGVFCCASMGAPLVVTPGNTPSDEADACGRAPPVVEPSNDIIPAVTSRACKRETRNARVSESDVPGMGEM